MLSGRRFVSIDDMGDTYEEIEDLGEIVSTEKRRVGSECETVDFHKGQMKRLVKLEAMRTLKAAGWKQDKIALAVGYTERHFRRLKAGIGIAREVAEIRGRV